MEKHRTEYDFMNDVVGKLRQARAEVLRMETGGTALGVPDIYVMFQTKHKRPGYVTWIETKRVDCAICTGCGTFIVPWHKAQQNFAEKYRTATAKKKGAGHALRHTWTFVEGLDGVLLIPMDRSYDDCKVNLYQPNLIAISKSEWQSMSGGQLYELMYFNSVTLHSAFYVRDSVHDMLHRKELWLALELYDTELDDTSAYNLHRDVVSECIKRYEDLYMGSEMDKSWFIENEDTFNKIVMGCTQRFMRKLGVV